MATTNKLKACPFCGGTLVYDSRKTQMSYVLTSAHCGGCHMEFTYQQDFALSAKSRVPMDDSFEEVWNSRTP